MHNNCKQSSNPGVDLFLSYRIYSHFAGNLFYNAVSVQCSAGGQNNLKCVSEIYGRVLIYQILLMRSIYCKDPNLVRFYAQQL